MQLNMDQWNEIADTVNELEQLQTELLEQMSGNVPKSVYIDSFEKIQSGTTTLKSDLEDRMFQEHPNEADVTIFYG